MAKASKKSSSVIEYQPTLTGATSFDTQLIQRVGNICSYRIALNPTSSSSGWYTLAQVPNDLVPYDKTHCICINDSTFAPMEVRLTTSGDLEVWDAVSGEMVWGQIIWFI